MKRRIQVSKIMTPNVHTVNLSNNLFDVKTLFDENHIHHVPVVSGTDLIGLISRTDLARISYVADSSDTSLSTAMYGALTIDKVMVKDVVTIDVHDTIQHAIDVFLAEDFHGLPVLEEGAVVGIVTTQDLLKFMHDNF